MIRVITATPRTEGEEVLNALSSRPVEKFGGFEVTLRTGAPLSTPDELVILEAREARQGIHKRPSGGYTFSLNAHLRPETQAIHLVLLVSEHNRMVNSSPAPRRPLDHRHSEAYTP
jgi:hypothetical protein